MHVNVTFRHMESTAALKQYAEEKSLRLEKYLIEPIEIHWVLSVEKIRHIADATISANGVTIKAHEATPDMYSSIDMVIDKLSIQVKKHKEKVKIRKVHGGQEAEAPYIEAPEEGVAARIIKRENRVIKPMSVEEAAMQMDLADENFLVFTDSVTSNINIIYRMKGGDYGLIEEITR